MPIINFYSDVKDVKKHLDNSEDPQHESTGIKIDSRILFCGSSGSGKSNALLNMIYLMSSVPKGTFKHIFICYKTQEPLYEYLSEKLKKNITFFKSVSEFPPVQEFKDLVSNKEKERFLCIFDDCVNDLDKHSKKKIQDYFAFSRKKGITTAFLSQSYFSTIKFVRDNCNYIILNSIRSVKDLDRIMREYAISDITLDQLRKMFEYATEEKLSFLKIDLNNVPIDKKFSKGFTDFLDPSQF